MSCIHGDDPTKCISCEMLRKRPIKLMTGPPKLGQDTGAENELEQGKEARRLLKMIADSGNMYRLDEKSAEFVREQMLRADTIVTHFRVTGKQLFWLRDLKDLCL